MFSVFHPIFSKKIKHLSYIPLCLAIAACGGGGSGGGDSDSGTPPAPSNSAPVATDDSASISNRDVDVVIDVLANDSDTDSDTLTITSVSKSKMGVAPAIEDGKIRYKLAAGTKGEDSFTYVVSDGTAQSEATVTVRIEQILTISGAIGEAVSGEGLVTVYVAGEANDALLEENRYSVDIKNADEDALVVIESRHQNTSIDKTIILKSYAGSISELNAQATSGRVDETKIPALYLSAASTATSAFLEKAAGGEITSTDTLINASQTLPQALVFESATTLKSILSGDSWFIFSQDDTYSLLESYPDAISIAESMVEEAPEKYLDYRAAILRDSKQFLSQDFASNEELIFTYTTTRNQVIGATAIQLSETASGTGYLATANTQKSTDNSTPVSFDGQSITASVEGILPPTAVNYQPECATNEESSSHSYVTPIRIKLTKYLETPVFSAYAEQIEYQCDETLERFFSEPSFVQLNKRGYGSFASEITATFAIHAYQDVDQGINTTSAVWRTTVVEPNSTGGISLRTDFNSGYSDTGTISLLSPGKLKLSTQQTGDVEYTIMGTEGSMLKAVGLVRRQDGTIASVRGGYMVPVTPGIKLPTPSTLAYSEPNFHEGLLSDSKYFYGGFAFEFHANNIANILIFNGVNYDPLTLDYSWTEQPGYLDMRLYDVITSDGSYNYLPECPEDAVECTLYSVTEFEPLAQFGNDYILRYYAASGSGGADYKTDLIVRYTILP
ncbi:Ig-like domain-containing protein [Microbulbifer aggregans]|uniref:Ig-like domain-containing protein n=1 Tax=Microbulbifer aggregans TaxID=1769779 RepID=UPI001CFD3732|nr:Ig-like domain-containing protein [Microbulbifer aggregans]